MVDNIPISALLQHITEQMKDDGLWSSQIPPESALASQQPFAIDTLSPEQWLQWIFIPKMQQLLNDGSPLPKPLHISPYFEEAWPQKYPSLLALIGQLEQALL